MTHEKQYNFMEGEEGFLLIILIVYYIMGINSFARIQDLFLFVAVNRKPDF